MHGTNIKIIGNHFFFKWTGVAQSVQRLATGQTVRESNPGGSEVFRTRPDRPWGPPSLLYSGYWVSFPGVKRPGPGVDHTPPPPGAEVKERVELYFAPPLCLRDLFQSEHYLVQLLIFENKKVLLSGKFFSYCECENKKKVGGLCKAQIMRYLQGAVETVSQAVVIFPYPCLLSASLKKCNIAVSTCQSKDTFINRNNQPLQ